MRNAQPDAPGFKWVALCVPLVLTACGGGDGTEVAGTPTGSPTPGPKSAAGTSTGTAVGSESAALASTAAAAAAPSQSSAAEAGGQAKSAPGGARNSVGLWSADTPWPLNGLHAVLTPDGKVMSYGTDPDGTQGARFYYDVWT